MSNQTLAPNQADHLVNLCDEIGRLKDQVAELRFFAREKSKQAEVLQDGLNLAQTLARTPCGGLSQGETLEAIGRALAGSSFDVKDGFELCQQQAASLEFKIQLIQNMADQLNTSLSESCLALS